MGQPKWNLISDGDIRPVNEISDMKLLCHLGSESAIIQKLCLITFIGIAADFIFSFKESADIFLSEYKK